MDLLKRESNTGVSLQILQEFLRISKGGPTQNNLYDLTTLSAFITLALN